MFSQISSVFSFANDSSDLLSILHKKLFKCYGNTKNLISISILYDTKRFVTKMNTRFPAHILTMDTISSFSVNMNPFHLAVSVVICFRIILIHNKKKIVSKVLLASKLYSLKSALQTRINNCTHICGTTKIYIKTHLGGGGGGI